MQQFIPHYPNLFTHHNKRKLMSNTPTSSTAVDPFFLDMDYYNTIRIFQLVGFGNESAQQYLADGNRLNCVSLTKMLDLEHMHRI